jgi:crotonobetainyl-CoA:carnitine CoA-transferase CaiB-like acyl-CoA transferase
VRVIELTRDIAGGWCGRLLAMLGADVIKVESHANPDGTRRLGPYPGDVPGFESSASYRYLHAQKRSLGLDVSVPSGARLLERLAATADVLLDDGTLAQPPEALARYHELLAANERLVVCAFSPFGLEGPECGFVAMELISLAAGGWLTASEPGEEPLMPGSSCAAYGAGTFGAIGVLLALRERRRSGRGQVVDAAANEALLSLLAFPTTLFAYGGPDGMYMGHVYPFAVFPCADGHLGVSILTQRQWEGLCRLMGREDMLSEPRFADGATRARPEVVDEIMQIIGEWAATQPAFATFVAAQEQRVPLAIIPSPREVLASPQYAAREYWVDFVDPVLGQLRIPGRPYRASEGTFAPFRPAPALGAHTGEILGELALEPGARAALAAAGVLT